MLAREDSPDTGKPNTYWIVHGTSLLRVAPEHIRPEVKDDGKDLKENLDAAKTAAEVLRARSTTQFTDLRNTPPPPIDVDSDDDSNMDAPNIPAHNHAVPPPEFVPNEPATPRAGTEPEASQ